jgi:hypothetical protein
MKTKGISANPMHKAIHEGIGCFLSVAERAKSAEITISMSADAVPTISYKVDQLPILVKEVNDERRDADH